MFIDVRLANSYIPPGIAAIIAKNADGSIVLRRDELTES
jgi:hypothetical protein